MNDVLAHLLAAGDFNWVNLLFLLVPLAIGAVQWLFKKEKVEPEELTAEEEQEEKIKLIREAVRRARAAKLAEKPAAAPPPLAEEARMAQQEQPDAARKAPALPEVAEEEPGTRKNAFLGSRSALRAAVVAREVLSPPLSLRR